MPSANYRPWMVLGLSVLLMGLMLWMLVQEPAVETAGPKPNVLTVFCAAGVRVPVEGLARQFEREYGVPVRLHYGGSQTLLASLMVVRRGDLYVPADECYVELARTKGLVAEAIPLARMSLVLAVRKGNPKGIRSLEDLPRLGATLSQANPEAAAVGKLTRETLEKSGLWDALKQCTVVFKPTVNDVANDLKLGAVDAGFVWDVTCKQYPELETVPVPALSRARANLAIGVLCSSEHPPIALKLARYLAAPEKGLQEFARHGYEPVMGDAWADVPEVVLYCGAMNRVAVEEILNRFEQREGVRLTRVYNGCGILVAQMKAGGRPDAYLTCDRSFVPPVADLFIDSPVEISDSEIVMLVPQGNPKGLRALADLTRSGLRVGLANAEQSTLGALTRRLLEQAGLLEAVMANVVTQTPTADLLVNQMRTGALDAVVVYVSNTTQVREQLAIVPLNLPGAVAVQTYSIAKNSNHKQLMGRLLDALRSDTARASYEAAGFAWRGNKP